MTRFVIFRPIPPRLPSLSQYIVAKTNEGITLKLITSSYLFSAMVEKEDLNCVKKLNRSKRASPLDSHRTVRIGRVRAEFYV
jgi:hypothetical protein